MIVVEYAGLPGSTVTMPARSPLYRQIIADIRDRIASGEWPPGHKLPSTSALTEHYRQLYDVGSASTVRQAVTLLLETGELEGRQGLGVFVPKTPPV